MSDILQTDDGAAKAVRVRGRTRYAGHGCRCSLHDLVGEREQHRRHVEAERLGGHEVDDQLELGRLQDGQVGRFLALENAGGVKARLATRIETIVRVAHQPAGGHIRAVAVARRDAVAGRERDDLRVSAGEERKGTRVTFLDQTGAKSVEAVIADTVSAKRILPNIITKMNLPVMGPDGQPMSYSLDHKEGGKRLREDDTLPAAGVQDGHHLIVYPEIVAG